METSFPRHWRGSHAPSPAKTANASPLRESRTAALCRCPPSSHEHVAIAPRVEVLDKRDQLVEAPAGRRVRVGKQQVFELVHRRGVFDLVAQRIRIQYVAHGS